MVNLYDKNGRSLYFSNRKEYYRRKRISETKLKQFAEQRRRKEEGKVLRYSVAFLTVRGDEYGKTKRAIILDPQPLARRKLIIGELKERLRRKLQKENQWAIPTTEAFEREEIDLVEAEGLPINKIFFEGF